MNAVTALCKLGIAYAVHQEHQPRVLVCDRDAVTRQVASLQKETDNLVRTGTHWYEKSVQTCALDGSIGSRSCEPPHRMRMGGDDDASGVCATVGAIATSSSGWACKGKWVLFQVVGAGHVKESGTPCRAPSRRLDC